jgi:ADP-ribosyl-[dinitrogen reductase] hydrolase
VSHSRAQLALADGRPEDAEPLAAAALAVFERCNTRYDVTHALLTVSEIATAAGREREAVQRGAHGRQLVGRHGYGLLHRTNPGTAFPLGERIIAALTAYACGDALGLPWEQQARPATAAEIEALPPRPGWPAGATSDDTALTMLVAGYLAEYGDDADALTLLGQIAGQAPQIRGLGPSTRRAIEHFRTAGELPQEDGATNGAAMRALPIGWATPLDAAERRRGLVIELSRATHPSAQAQCAACVIAACGSWAIEGASSRLIVEVAAGEAAEAARICGAEPGLEPMLHAVAAGTWQAPEDGVSLDPYQTVAAVLSCVLRAASLRDALVEAVRMGGDTDTVAALVGGLLGAPHTGSGHRRTPMERRRPAPASEQPRRHRETARPHAGIRRRDPTRIGARRSPQALRGCRLPGATHLRLLRRVSIRQAIAPCDGLPADYALRSTAGCQGPSPHRSPCSAPPGGWADVRSWRLC